MTELPRTIAEAATALRSGRVSAVELARAVLDRAADLDAQLGCFLACFDETAVAAAATADRELARGLDRGPLHGVPLGIKDLLAAREGATTAHSRVRYPFVPPGSDAAAVSRLRDAGAVIIGKTSLSEYGFGVPDIDSGLPVPRNPWNIEHWPGGSSSGTAIGVASGFFLGGVGTDTGGSIRIPAACCGISGLKPTYGLVPTTGCIPAAYSFDTVGPMARTVEDCELLLNALAPGAESKKTGLDISGLRVGVERVHTGVQSGADPTVVAHVEDAVAALEAAGARVDEVNLAHWPLVDAAKLVITYAEAFTVHRAGLQAHWGQYGARTRMQLSQGLFVSAPDYVQAQRVRSMVIAELRDALTRVDVLILPTVGVPPPPLNTDFIGLQSLLFTGVANLTGLPALSAPVEPVGGLPVGMQIIGRPYDEATLLAVGRAYQERTAWHQMIAHIQ